MTAHIAPPDRQPATVEEPKDSGFVRVFERWQPALLLLLYFAILIFYFVAPHVSWLKEFQKTGLDVAIIGMIGILLRPFLRLIANADETRGRISDVQEQMRQFKSPDVGVTARQGRNALSASIDRYDAPLVFLGFRDELAAKAVLKALRAKGRGTLYINPGVLPILIEDLGLDYVERGQTLRTRIFVTDCPRESCAVFGHDAEQRINCDIFRYMPRTTIISRPEECFWRATLTPGAPYAEYLYNTYERHYRRKAATLLNSPLKARLLSDVNDRRIGQNRQLIADNLSVLTRPLSYLYATSLIKQAKHCVDAIDFMSPWLWVKTNGLVYEYLQAFSAIMAAKRRIHAYKKEHLQRDGRAYIQLIGVHNDMNIDLRFIEEGLVHQTGIHRGFAIVDDQVVFSADDLHSFDDKDNFTLDELEDAQFIGDSGAFDFREEEVRRHKELFDRILHKGSNILLTAEEFKDRITL